MCGSNFYESDVTTNKIIKPIIDHDLKNFANSRPSASNLNIFSRSLEQFFITVGQNNFGNKIPNRAPFNHLWRFLGLLLQS